MSIEYGYFFFLPVSKGQTDFIEVSFRLSSLGGGPELRPET